MADRIPTYVAQDPAPFIKQLSDILANLQALSAAKTSIDAAVTAVAQFGGEIDSDNLPSAAAGNLGRIYMVTHAATDTVVKMCVRNKAHTGYEWVELGKTAD